MLQDNNDSDYINKYDHSGDPSKSLSINQRSQILKEASSDYLKGKVTEDQLEKIEDDLSTDYGKAAYDLSSVTFVVLNALKKLFSLRTRGKLVKKEFSD